MDRVPAEILVNIILFLSIRNKLTCVLVSKKWKEIITASIFLYSTLSFRSTEKLNTAMSFFNDNRQHLAKIVNHLSLDDIIITPQLMSSLLGLFLNVKCLVWNDHDEEVFNDNDSNDNTDFYVSTHIPSKDDFHKKLVVWKDLRYIFDDSYNLRILLCLLEACSLVYLKHLTITGWLNEVDLSSFLSNIKNAPHLTQRTLRDATMDLGDMEQLHSSLPKLEILSLRIEDEWNDTQDVIIEDSANSV